jgi:hypothetical protein
MGPDALARGYSHHHSDDALRQWQAVSAERKLEWLAEALELTRAMLPRERRREWMALRGEEPGASIPLGVLKTAWPRLVAALDSGDDALFDFARELAGEGHSRSDVKEILLALKEWLPFRESRRPSDPALLDRLLARVA